MALDRDDGDDLDEFGIGYAGRGVSSPSHPPTIPPTAPLLEDSSLNPGTLFDDLLKNNPAFKDLLAKRTAMAPVTKPVRSQFRDSAQIGFGPIDIPSGHTITVSTTSYSAFRPQRFVANESVPMSTEIVGMFIGQMNVFPNAPGSGLGISSASFAPSALSNGMSFPTAHVGIPISIMVKNSSNVSVKWSGALFGQQL